VKVTTLICCLGFAVDELPYFIDLNIVHEYFADFALHESLALSADEN